MQTLDRTAQPPHLRTAEELQVHPSSSPSLLTRLTVQDHQTTSITDQTCQSEIKRLINQRYISFCHLQLLKSTDDHTQC